MTQAPIDEARMGEFMGRMAGYMTGGALCFGVWLGDELGLYRSLSAGPKTADELAGATGCHPRLVREWADGQAAGGLIDFDPETASYVLSPEGVAALADDSSPAFVARGMNAFLSVSIDHAKIADAFRGDGALGWGDHHPCLFKGTEWFFRTGYRAFLPGEWIPALDGVDAKLRAGASVAEWAAGTAPRRWSLPPPIPTPRCQASTTTHPRSTLPANEPPKPASAIGPRFELADAKSYPAATI